MVLPRNVLISRALETRRKTSVLLSCTRAMRNPSSRGASSRTIVSTSGSSGTLDLAPGDIAPPGFALEGNPLRPRAARSRGQRDVRAQTRDVQRSEEHTSELQSPCNLVCRLLLEKKKKNSKNLIIALAYSALPAADSCIRAQDSFPSVT